MAFEIDTIKYKPVIFYKDMTGAQFIDYSSICKDIPKDELIYHIHELLGCFCVHKKYEGYNETAEIFHDKMTMDIAYPYYVFFCKVLTGLQPDMENYLISKAKEQMRQVRKLIKKAA